MVQQSTAATIDHLHPSGQMSVNDPRDFLANAKNEAVRRAI
jgi:hypothetical protein